jgi:hypothetical protein
MEESGKGRNVYQIGGWKTEFEHDRWKTVQFDSHTDTLQAPRPWSNGFVWHTGYCNIYTV